MARSKKEDARVGGMPLALRFGLSMTLALAAVMAVVGALLNNATRGVAVSGIERALEETALLSAELQPSGKELVEDLHSELDERLAQDVDVTSYEKSEREVARAVRDEALVTAKRTVSKVVGEIEARQPWKQVGDTGTTFSDGHGTRFPVYITSGDFAGQDGFLYQVNRRISLLAPESGKHETQKGLFGLILATTLAVIVVGAGVAYWVANRVSGPLVAMVDDVRQISRGNLSHRTRVRGGGEVALLARSIDRMSESLQEAQEAELELSVREREMEVAREVREALGSKDVPALPDYLVDRLHIACPEPEGDFYEFVQVARGGVGLLVCEVNGRGVPGALVGATARAFLRSELERGADLVETFRKVNRDLVRDVRRGMYVTALYAQLDPSEGVATVVSAGHKLPLIRFSGADKKMRVVQPEGIALAFDRGPVFDKNLEPQRVPMEAGDRLFLANTGAVRVVDEEGEELGEKGFYQTLLRASAHCSAEQTLKQVESEIRAHAGEEPLPADVNVLLLARDTEGA